MAGRRRELKSARLKLTVEFDPKDSPKTRKRVMGYGQDHVVTPVENPSGLPMPEDWFASLVYHILCADYAWGGGQVEGKPWLYEYEFTFTPENVGVSHEERMCRMFGENWREKLEIAP